MGGEYLEESWKIYTPAVHEVLLSLAIVSSPALIATSSAKRIDDLLLSCFLPLLKQVLIAGLLEVRIAMPAPTPDVVLDPSVYMSIFVWCLCSKKLVISCWWDVVALGKFPMWKHTFIGGISHGGIFEVFCSKMGGRCIFNSSICSLTLNPKDLNLVDF